ncbi:hypothetical protein CDAR_597441 [Caerostris darwini]|uniref:Uncharacterized protein n=1 Tax=Caerostris darwini TaxID=1538125 RepID=A0AAV4TUT9_9ARAC|nr:hypothetical protein CDAR_597441 [Caerostris darwini]
MEFEVRVLKEAHRAGSSAEDRCVSFDLISTTAIRGWRSARKASGRYLPSLQFILALLRRAAFCRPSLAFLQITHMHHESRCSRLRMHVAQCRTLPKCGISTLHQSSNH